MYLSLGVQVLHIQVCEFMLINKWGEGHVLVLEWGNFESYYNGLEYRKVNMIHDGCDSTKMQCSYEGIRSNDAAFLGNYETQMMNH